MRISDIQKKMLPVFTQYGVLKASVFGSVARGADTKNSDVDILVSLRRPTSLSKFIALKRELEAATNKNVDVVEYDAVKPAFADSIFKDAKIIYEK